MKSFRSSKKVQNEFPHRTYWEQIAHTFYYFISFYNVTKFLSDTRVEKANFKFKLLPLISRGFGSCNLFIKLEKL